MSKNVIVMSHKGFVLIHLNEKKRTFIKKSCDFCFIDLQTAEPRVQCVMKTGLVFPRRRGEKFICRFFFGRKKKNPTVCIKQQNKTPECTYGWWFSCATLRFSVAPSGHRGEKMSAGATDSLSSTYSTDGVFLVIIATNNYGKSRTP